ncbi:MAG: S8 family serine peptidase, partial [Phycisphaerae bacterium]
MKAKRRVVRTTAGFVTMALLTLLVTNARSQDGRARPQVERAAADALEVIDTGFDLSRLEASFIPAQVKPSGLEPESVMPAAPAPERLVSVLVHFEAPNAVRGNAVVAARRQGVKTWAARVGGRVRHEYKNVLPNVINLRDVPESRLRALRAMPGVVEVEEDRTMHAHLTVSTPLIRALQSQITGAGHSADGSGVRVCIIDTGIDMDHVMYASRIDSAASWDFVNNDPNPQDDNGHGSNVAGIAVGGTGISLTRCGVSTTFQGVAPNATLIGVKVLNSQGSGSFSDVIAGIDHCADPGLPGGQADVINLSLGGGSFSGNCDSDSAATAANNAVDAGVVVVSSSGNECRGNAMGTPACGSKVIAVGAVYDDDFPNCEFPSQNGFTWCCDAFCFSTCTDNGPAQDSLTCFSNASNTIDVAAPGCIITSADNAPGGTTVSGVCGTSQASPHVAGLAALILSKDSTLTPAEVRQIIRDGAIDMGPSGFDSGYGWGRVDAINSLDLVSGGCTSDAQCDDGLFCNGAETCDIPSGNCQSGTAPNCNDGVGCTDDSCNEGTNSCDNVANDANCDDGQACNGAETCDAVNDCQAGTPVNCNDGVACTTDTCVEPGGTCSNTPDDAACDDGQFCNGAETCDPALGCQSGTAPNCNDGVGCTDDSCNEATDQCDN